MPVETRESVEAQGGYWHGTFPWPLDDNADAFWAWRAKEPHVRYEQHVGNRVDVYSIPTKSAWAKAGFPPVYRFTFDAEGLVNGGNLMTQQEVDDYREAMYGVKDKPPVRPMKSSEPDTIPEGEYSGVTSKAKYTAKQVKRRAKKEKA